MPDNITPAQKTVPAAVAAAMDALAQYRLWPEAARAVAPETLGKTLPALALRMEKAGEDVSADRLLAELRKGAEHWQAFTARFAAAPTAQKKQRDYAEIVAALPKPPEPELPLDQQMYRAAENGDTKTVKRLLDRGVDIHARNFNPLRGAAANGHLNTVKFLLDCGADLHATGDDALRAAAQNGHLDTVKFLLDCGADLHATGDDALRAAAQNGHLDTVKFLLDCGADACARSNDALCTAAREGHTEIVALLLDHGADIHAGHDYALRMAVNNGHTETVALLLDRDADTNAQNNEALRSALYRRNYKMVQLLLDHGAADSCLAPKQRHSFERWQLWRKIHPTFDVSGDLLDENPYHFRQETFLAVETLLKKEGYNGSECASYAYHAASLFGTEDRVLRYLERWGIAGKQPLHDIIHMIAVPCEGRPDLAAWGDAVLQHGPKLAKFVKFSDRMPQPEKDATGKAWSLVRTREKAATFAFRGGEQHPALAALCLEHAWRQHEFDSAVEQVAEYQKKYAGNDNKKPGGRIPAIAIDGAAFGRNGWRFSKLPDGDLRGLLLGEFTNCCQHLAGAGKACAKHGFLSEQSGFYVLENEKSGVIAAQAWAWRGKKDELVLDSLEALAGHMDSTQWRSLCTEFARQAMVDKQASIAAVHVGKGGNTPADLGFPTANPPVTPADYKGYRDSSKQFVVATKGEKPAIAPR